MHTTHTLAQCPLRTFACITATEAHPHHILHLDNAALDLFLTGSNQAFDLDKDLDHQADLRARARVFLQGKTLGELLLPDRGSACLSETHNRLSKTKGVQSFVLAEDALHTLLSHSSNTPLNRRRPRRLHGCIHTTVQEVNLAVAPTPSTYASSSSSCSASSRPHPSPSSPPSRLYVLKEITELHGLALAARQDLWVTGRLLSPQQPLVLPDKERRSLHAPLDLAETGVKEDLSCASISCLSVVSLPADAPSCSRERVQGKNDQQQQQQQQQQHHQQEQEDGQVTIGSNASDWSHSSARHCPVREQSTSTVESYENLAGVDQGLLLLQVTRFGTVDHAFAIHQNPSQHDNQDKQDQHHIFLSFLAHNQDEVQAMTNTSLMSYTHPDDLRLLCQSLDKTCKALYTVFRVRWRVSALGRPGYAPSTDQTLDSSNNPTLSPSPSTPRKIEFQGQLFEEWVDPTAVPDSAPTSNLTSSEQYLWTEITGVVSRGQPLLVVRPMTLHEARDHVETLNLSVKRGIRSMDRMAIESDAHREQHPWRKKSKRMGWEEGMRMPKGSTLSALTTLTISPQERMPGSFPPHWIDSHHDSSRTLTSSSSSMSSASRCRIPASHSRSSSGAVTGMPSILAFPSATPSWSVWTSLALDAWKQWIQTVEAGQAQFQDWCEYLVDTALDQLLESLSFGLRLLGWDNSSLEDSSDSRRVHDRVQESALDQSQDDPSRQSERVDRPLQFLEASSSDPYSDPLSMELDSVSSTQPFRESGIERASRILESYPHVGGVVRQLGHSWLGRKIKGRLGHRLDGVAHRALDWWESEALTAFTPLTTSPTRPSDSLDSPLLSTLSSEER